MDTPKAVISNRIYFRTDSANLKRISNLLTYKIEKNTGNKSKFKQIELVKNYKIISGNIISIPQGRLDLVPEELEVTDKRVKVPVNFPIPLFPLREGQQEVYNKVDDSCFINALVGWGKTFTALWIAYKLGQKTLVVTHTTMLRDQWIKEIELLFDFTPGIIGSGKYNIDSLIVVGNVQTVTKFVPELSKEFGTIILDEAHHCPATTFSAVVDGMHARYRIALSGTMERTDGKHVVFRDYFGNTVFKPPQSHTLNPVVKIIQTGLALPMSEPWVKKINSLLYDEDYQHLIAGIALRQMNKGHSVLIVANRTEFLENIKEIIGPDCVLITSKTENREELLKEIDSKTKTCIAGASKIFTEGLSVNILSCVILAEPTSNYIILEQLIGRIMRKHPDKLQPLVIDMAFSSPTDRKQNSKRLAFYVGKGWDVIPI